MGKLAEFTSPIAIPELPSGSVKDFIPYLSKNAETSIAKIIEPYKDFEAQLRKVYAQQPKHEVVQDGTLNLVPIFAGHEQDLKIRARSLDTESEDEKSRYIMPLKNKDRKPSGSPAVVDSFKDFQQNFNLFSESSLTGIDWNNVVAAGSAVTTALLPVPEKWAGSKRTLREYYHEHLAPASDVDLFIYGLNEEQGLEKIKHIERSIKDSILHETTTIRTKNAITIASQYPTRHVQIVLRLYDSISQIITGFDVDCACAAFDGEQVYAAPRAIAAFVTQCNTIDLARRSPSYESRLSKYSHRGFEIYWPLLDRSRIDPTIFERSFGRTLGLARLLILEKLPKSDDRDAYMDQRRSERGRPSISRGYRNQHKMWGNIKDREEDEVAEWVYQEDVASYHTMTVPYGPKFHAGKINRLLYAKDILLNAEWNQQKDREVYLHRHPCFFGTAEEVLQDCCGFCPLPKTDEEYKIAEEETKIMVSGELNFIVDDPGRQEIGSFNPITDDEWTTMAYVGDTARLCQAIVDGDLEHVQDWCSQDGVEVNRRDYTGRTPLHLATMTSTLEVVKCLIDHGARLIARLVDGKTALHIAAARGNAEMVQALMDRSTANEAKEDELEESRRAARKADRAAKDDSKEDDIEDDSSSETSEISLGSHDTDEESDSMTTGSFVKIKEGKPSAEETVLEDTADDPDVYDIDVVAWDYGLSPLHFAILNGQLNVVELLVSEYGADVLLPVKLIDSANAAPRGAIMTILLAMTLPEDKAKKTVELLLKLGATSAQADMNHVTVLHFLAAMNNHEILDVLLSEDRPVAMSVLNHIGSDKFRYSARVYSPLSSAINSGHEGMASKLLELGANVKLHFDDWVKVYISNHPWVQSQKPEIMELQFRKIVDQPIIEAATRRMAKVVEDLIAHGADPSTFEKAAHDVLQNPHSASYQTARSLLDIIRKNLEELRGYKHPTSPKPETLRDERCYTSGFTPGTYQYWSALRNFQAFKRENTLAWENYQENLKIKSPKGLEEKERAITTSIRELEHAEKVLLDAGAKTFEELHPDVKHSQGYRNNGFKIPEPSPYETTLTFLVSDLNDTKREGYKKLFDAAWNNDLDTIKELTLGQWSSPPLPPQQPLRIAVQDRNYFSPFSIAVLRGHYDLADRILEICIAQYHKDDGLSTRQRWNMQTDDSDDDCSETEHDHLPIFSELVSDRFTVDNLGEVSNIVKSDIMPLVMLNWPCAAHMILESPGQSKLSSLLGYAIEINDLRLMRYILQTGAEQQSIAADQEDKHKCYTLNATDFHTAITFGRTSMLAEMIKATGAGIPLNDLIKKSGIEIKDKPRYYQGLSVGGKKRADWAQAPHGSGEVIEEKVPPLLHAAHAGSLDSVEWFMSDAPMRRYKEFAESNKDDKRIKSLEESGKGFDKTIGSWLTAKSELVLHCAILYNPAKLECSPNYLALIKHLISVMPESLEQRSSDGWTPLQVSVFIDRHDVAAHLVSVGANQRNRDKQGRNMVHSMVSYKRNAAKTDTDKLQAMIDLFDKEAIKEMLVERTVQPGSSTPLAHWISWNRGLHKKADFISLITKHSTGEDLEMIDGQGDLPLHAAIRQNLSSITEHLLSLNPALLYRENATGRTALEMSRDIYLAAQVANPIPIAPNRWSAYHPTRVDQTSPITKSPDDFVKKEEPEENQKRTWEICNSTDESMHDKKRRLVSLFEANEVAKRLAALRGVNESNPSPRGTVKNVTSVDEGKADVVSEWM